MVWETVDDQSEGDQSEDDFNDSSSSMSDTDSDSDVNTTESVTGVAEDLATAEEEDGEDEDDEVVKAIQQARDRPREHPPDILCEDFSVDLSFHPKEDILAVASITGDVILHKFTNEATEILKTLELHMKACRDIEFSEDGETLFSCSKDKSIILSDTNSGKMKRVFENAHEDPLYCLLVMDEHLIASGDDSGTVKLWDVRKSDPIFSLKEMDDYVSCMETTEAKKYLVCASGEGSLTALNLTSRKLHLQSEMYEAELTSMGLMKNDSKLVVSSSKGKLYLFNWGEFGYHSDEFPGPQKAINDLLPITENIVVSACEDGVIRATHLFPHRHLGIVGQHQFSVESLDISGRGDFLASSSHDQVIKFWNIKYFEDITVSDKEKAKKKKELSHNLPSSKYKNASDFFSELS